MRQWNYRIDIKKFLSDEETPEAMMAAVNGIRSEVLKLPVGITWGAHAALTKMALAASANEIDWFNASLDRFYDWADRERVWVSGV